MHHGVNLGGYPYLLQGIIDIVVSLIVQLLLQLSSHGHPCACQYICVSASCPYICCVPGVVASLAPRVLTVPLLEVFLISAIGNL